MKRILSVQVFVNLLNFHLWPIYDRSWQMRFIHLGPVSIQIVVDE